MTRELVPGDHGPAGLPAGPAGTPGGLVLVHSPTEERNARTADIDEVSILGLLEVINDEDAAVPGAVRAALPQLATLVEAAVERIGRGGRIHYFGAGSSGRLGVLDAAELPPTYGVRDDLFVAHLAGGEGAVRRAQEGSEDDAQQGRLEAGGVRPADVVIGIAASGYTPYVEGALRHSRGVGACTALITSNPAAPIARSADITVCVETGPEVITGSTRMKSATAQKLVLNAFSTAVMVRTGRTWSNLMVDMVPLNAKLRGRTIRMLDQATGLGYEDCERALLACGNEPKTALVVLKARTDPESARTMLAAAGGVVAAALRTALRKGDDGDMLT